jgi:hypothetical protein
MFLNNLSKSFFGSLFWRMFYELLPFKVITRGSQGHIITHLIYLGNEQENKSEASR